MNLETFKELLLKQQSSGLTVKAFCEQEHLSMSNWCYWKRKCTTPMQDALVPMQLQHKVLGRDQESIPASSNVCQDVLVKVLIIKAPTNKRVS